MPCPQCTAPSGPPKSPGCLADIRASVRLFVLGLASSTPASSLRCRAHGAEPFPTATPPLIIVCLARRLRSSPRTRRKFLCLCFTLRRYRGARPISTCTSRRPDPTTPVSSAREPRASKPRVPSARISVSTRPSERLRPPSTGIAYAAPPRCRGVPVRSAFVGAAPTVAMRPNMNKGRTRWPLAP